MVRNYWSFWHLPVRSVRANSPSLLEPSPASAVHCCCCKHYYDLALRTVRSSEEMNLVHDHWCGDNSTIITALRTRWSPRAPRETFGPELNSQLTRRWAGRDQLPLVNPHGDLPLLAALCFSTYLPPSLVYPFLLVHPPKSKIRLPALAYSSVDSLPTSLGNST